MATNNAAILAAINKLSDSLNVLASSIEKASISVASTKTTSSKKEKQDEGAVASKIGDTISTAIVSGMAALQAKLIMDAKEIYGKIQATPYEEVKKFGEEAIQAGQAPDRAMMHEMHKRWTNIGRQQTELDKELTRDYGLTGSWGAWAKERIAGGLELLKGTSQQEDELDDRIRQMTKKKNKDEMLKNNRRQGD
jgi:hypothetical protein